MAGMMFELGWLDAAQAGPGPAYLRLLNALEHAIRTGELAPGDRLPPQRLVAARLSLDLTTVTRAYSAARDRGLLDGAAGRGTFVRSRLEDDEAGLVDLSMNLPPPPEGQSLGAAIRETAADILQRTDCAVLMAYHPDFGAPKQRSAGARWLAPSLGPVETDRLLVSPGAQAALAAVLTTICKPGDTVVAEPLTYPGFTHLARHLGLRVLTCPCDDDGLVPEALEALCAQARPAALYVTPTMQNPTARTMPGGRRSEVMRIAAAAGVWVVEDDPYSRLMEAPPPALASLAPEWTFHIATLSKCLSPGLRVAYLVCPRSMATAVAQALRATALMPAPLMVAVATRWILDGAADRLLGGVRAEARARRALAARILPQGAGAPESLHIWLPLRREIAPDQLRLGGQERGLALVTAEAFAAGPDHPPGARVSLGGARNRRVLETALKALAELVDLEPPPRTIV